MLPIFSSPPSPSFLPLSPSSSVLPPPLSWVGAAPLWSISPPAGDAALPDRSIIRQQRQTSEAPTAATISMVAPPRKRNTQVTAHVTFACLLFCTPSASLCSSSSSLFLLLSSLHSSSRRVASRFSSSVLNQKRNQQTSRRWSGPMYNW